VCIRLQPATLTARQGTCTDCALSGQVDYFRACPSSCNNPGLKIAVTESRFTSRIFKAEHF